MRTVSPCSVGLGAHQPTNGNRPSGRCAPRSPPSPRRCPVPEAVPGRDARRVRPSPSILGHDRARGNQQPVEWPCGRPVGRSNTCGLAVLLAGWPRAAHHLWVPNTSDLHVMTTTSTLTLRRIWLVLHLQSILVIAGYSIYMLPAVYLCGLRFEAKGDHVRLGPSAPPVPTSDARSPIRSVLTGLLSGLEGHSGHPPPANWFDIEELPASCGSSSPAFFLSGRKHGRRAQQLATTHSKQQIFKLNLAAENEGLRAKRC